MPGNRAVAYLEPGHVEVQTIEYPKLELQDGPGVNPANVGRKTPHGVILKIVSTNICGSDQHMVRGRTTAPQGLVLGHEITGEVIEAGRGRRVHQGRRPGSAPRSTSPAGAAGTARKRKTGICLNVNPDAPGAAYGYVDMGGWVGGQAEYVMVPYADFNLLKFPDKDQAMAKIRDLTCCPTSSPPAITAPSRRAWTTGSTVYVAGAGPVGPGLRRTRPAARRRGRHRRRHDSGAARAGQELRLRDRRPAPGRVARGSDRADPRRARGGLPRWIASASRPRGTVQDARRGAGHRAEFAS